MAEYNDFLRAVLKELDLFESNSPQTKTCEDLPSLSGTRSGLAHYLAYNLYALHEVMPVSEESEYAVKRKALIYYASLKKKLKHRYYEQQGKNEPPKPNMCKLTKFHSARYNVNAYQEAKSAGLSQQILHPEAMPVEVSKREELLAFFNRLRNHTPAAPVKQDINGQYEEFDRGAYYTDGRIDLCKQVVGPDHIQELMDSFKDNPNIKHFLLGNNIIGTVGAEAIAKAIPVCQIETWYIAGNSIDSSGAAAIAAALAHDTYCKQLWLKRNPIGTEGVRAIAAMLETNTSIEVLDLVNTAMFDEGCVALFESLKKNSTLKYLYLDSNGLTSVAAHAIADYFRHKPSLQMLSLSINRLGDEGAKIISDANPPLVGLSLDSNRIELDGLRSILDYASRSHSLRVLDIGYYKATADMGELPNSFGNEGAKLLADFIRLNTPLQYLGCQTTHITNLDDLTSALKTNTNLHMLATEQFAQSTAEIHAVCQKNAGLTGDEYKTYIRKLRHGPNVPFIDSIYRNTM